ncbi:hypothetical protein FALBO_14218 [Fusarium albosuccineum]|uniref:Uncharacterized protein n=1 Tax=Fusarium albosuccineum TaxID=1237068 RepID=A0A8H4PFS8_9HYPO|nr:hypothetical protein FALBO_14218 [Fusarium albosuccineum]
MSRIPARLLRPGVPSGFTFQTISGFKRQPFHTPTPAHDTEKAHKDEETQREDNLEKIVMRAIRKLQAEDAEKLAMQPWYYKLFGSGTRRYIAWGKDA